MTSDTVRVIDGQDVIATHALVGQGWICRSSRLNPYPTLMDDIESPMNLRLNFLSFALLVSVGPALGACGKKAELPAAPVATTPEPAKPAAPEAAKPEPEAAKPAAPEAAKPEPEAAKPEVARPAEPEVAKLAEPEVGAACKLLSFGRLPKKAKSYDSLLALVTKLYGDRPDGPKTEEAAKAMLWAFANSGPDNPAPPYPANGIFLIVTGDYGPTGSIQSLLVPKEGGKGFWVAEGVTVADPPGMSLPSQIGEAQNVFAAALAKSGEPLRQRGCGAALIGRPCGLRRRDSEGRRCARLT